MSSEKRYLEPVNGIAEAINYPEAGEEVTLRGSGETVTVARVDRRRHHPIILDNHPFGLVRKRALVEYSERVEPEEITPNNVRTGR